MDVSIIIVNYNTQNLLRNCLNSIFEKTAGIKFEIIVVDNNSSDNSVNMLEEEFGRVKLVKSSENLGFGRGNNLGLEQAQGKYILFLNSDCELINNAIKIMFDFMEKNQNCGACGGNLFDENKNYNMAAGNQGYLKDKIITSTLLKLIFRKRYNEIRYFEENFDRTKIAEVGFIIGADLMIKKSVLDQIGSFDQRFFFYFEEVELQHRILKAGYKIFFIPQAEIYHFEGKSSDNSTRKLIRQRSEYLYYKITQGFLAEMIVRFVTLPKYIKLLLRS